MWKELISFLDTERLTIVPKYFLPRGSPSTLPDNKSLIDGLTPTCWHRRRSLKLPLPCTPRYPHCRRLIPILFCLFAPFWWCPALEVTRGTSRELSTFLVVQTCKLVCLLYITLEMVQRIWPPAFGFV